MRKGSKHSSETLLQISLNRKGKAIGNSNAAGKPAWNRGLKNTWYNPAGLELGRGWNKGIAPDPISVQKMVATRRATGSFVAWNRGKEMPGLRGNQHAAGNVPWNKGKPFLSIRGELNVNWKGGVSVDNRRFKQTIEYKAWRKHVLARDNYTCQSCGVRGGKLHADHELPYAFFPGLRTEILNGRALCIPCHRKTETWGARENIYA